MAGLGLRRRAVVTGVCLSVLLATGVIVELHREAEPSRTAATPSASGPAPSHNSATRLPPPDVNGSADTQVPAHPADAIDGLLNARAAALRNGDRAAWLATLDPAKAPAIKRFRTTQGQLFDRVRQLRPAAWSYQVAGGSALPANRRATLGADSWLADVELDYQLTPGGAQARREQFLSMVKQGSSWRIGADTDGPTGRDIWDLGPISHALSQRCLVVGTQARRAMVGLLAAECGQAASTVDVAWGTSWTRRTVLTVPGTLSQLAVLLGRTSAVGSDAATTAAGLKRTAAVTIGPADGPADEVLVNGLAFDQLRALGRQVVLTHELVHVATRATGSRSGPTWLEEGFADYVAYRNTGLSPEQVAGDALDPVRSGHLPSRLPTTGDFNAAGNEAAAAYGQAWVAVTLIAGKAGSRARMKAFYQRAAVGPATRAGQTSAVNAAVAQLGLHTIAAFTRLWQARLRTLAH